MRQTSPNPASSMPSAGSGSTRLAPDPTQRPNPTESAPRLLITAGPTHEPIDAVRYIANRSSGRLGIALAEHASARGWRTTLLLGPTPRACTHTGVCLERFQTTAELEALLHKHVGACDVLIMAAAVADYRPARGPAATQTKLRRAEQSLTLELEPTPDLLAACASRRRPGQFFVGFALEPRERLRESASHKLVRKGLDLIVANPLETMDAQTIEATVFGRDGSEVNTCGAVEKSVFADWLLDLIDAHRALDKERQ